MEKIVIFVATKIEKKPKRLAIITITMIEKKSTITTTTLLIIVTLIDSLNPNL